MYIWVFISHMLFNAIIGQQEVKKRLIRSVHENRVSHAQLFLGGEGSGKLALAVAYAQYICCSDKKEDDSCGVCPSCVKFEKLIHPDLHFLLPFAANKDNPLCDAFLPEWRTLFMDKEGYIGLAEWYASIEMGQKQGFINTDACNEAIRILSFMPYESEYKIMLIWMIEKLYHAAAPKLLKILEEPPDKTLFLLVSEKYEQVIPTILSRTQLIKVPALKDKDIVQSLVARYELTPKRAIEIARLAGGNFCEATRLAENPGESFDFTEFRNWMRMCFKGDITELVSWSENFSKNGREAHKKFLLNALCLFRESLVLNSGNNEMLVSVAEERKFLNGFAPFINAKNAPVIIEEFDQAIFHVERNANPKIMFLDLALKMTALFKMKA